MNELTYCLLVMVKCWFCLDVAAELRSLERGLFVFILQEFKLSNRLSFESLFLVSKYNDFCLVEITKGHIQYLNFMQVFSGGVLVLNSNLCCFSVGAAGHAGCCCCCTVSL